MFMCPLVKTNS